MTTDDEFRRFTENMRNMTGLDADLAAQPEAERLMYAAFSALSSNPTEDEFIDLMRAAWRTYDISNLTWAAHAAGALSSEHARNFTTPRRLKCATTQLSLAFGEVCVATMVRTSFDNKDVMLSVVTAMIARAASIAIGAYKQMVIEAEAAMLKAKGGAQ